MGWLVIVAELDRRQYSTPRNQRNPSLTPASKASPHPDEGELRHLKAIVFEDSGV